jgi:uncharacterized protein YpmS
MTEYLVTYSSKLFMGYRVVMAANSDDARAEVEALGYKVKSVQLAVYED